MRTVKNIYREYLNIDGLIPGVRDQRAFPTRKFRDTDPFLMLDHIGPGQVGTDFFLDGSGHDHPHRGFETLTFMFEGRMDHLDSLGNRAELVSGSVQRMNAGSGIIHGGDMASDPATGRFHEMQLWVNNPQQEKLSKPDIQNIGPDEFPTKHSDEYLLKVVSGTLNGMTGPINMKAETQIAQLNTFGDANVLISGITEGNRLMLYVLEGQVQVDEETISAFDLTTFSDRGKKLQINAKGKAKLLILSGKRLNESVVFGGPFVMNTQEEIEQAQLDFSMGRFGKIDQL